MKREVSYQKGVLYIEPVTACNLNCQICYANFDSISKMRCMDKDLILSTVSKIPDLKHILWCGRGEVFLYPHLEDLVNKISNDYPKVKQAIQTNGITAKEFQFTHPEKVDIRVSIDGLKEAHEANRGNGTYLVSMCTAKRFYDRGHNVNIRAVITRKNIEHLLEFESEVKSLIGPKAYLSLIPPLDNEAMQSYQADYTAGAKTLNDDISISNSEALAYLQKLKESGYEDFVNRVVYLPDSSDLAPIKVYPSLYLEGLFTCCEGMKRIGDIEEVEQHLSNLTSLCSECNFQNHCHTEL